MMLTLALFLAADPNADVYEKDIKPILVEHCFKCHGAEEKIKGGLNLTQRKTILAGGPMPRSQRSKNGSGTA
jgi:hypothetical protein